MVAQEHSQPEPQLLRIAQRRETLEGPAKDLLDRVLGIWPALEVADGLAVQAVLMPVDEPLESSQVAGGSGSGECSISGFGRGHGFPAHRDTGGGPWVTMGKEGGGVGGHSPA